MHWKALQGSGAAGVARTHRRAPAERKRRGAGTSRRRRGLETVAGLSVRRGFESLPLRCPGAFPLPDGLAGVPTRDLAGLLRNAAVAKAINYDKAVAQGQPTQIVERGDLSDALRSLKRLGLADVDSIDSTATEDEPAPIYPLATSPGSNQDHYQRPRG